ncbi:MAG TPA: hypothetical protein VK116_17275, partial [Planctomycetota bacterium]|nr:hypothetical protein [Planctomycetota bacterium]
MAAYWSLDESSGSTFADFHGLHDATCTTCPTPVPGQLAGAQQFAVSGDLRVADASGLDVLEGGSFTFEAWVRPGANTTGLQIFM